jgi:hypothetical protein
VLCCFLENARDSVLSLHTPSYTDFSPDSPDLPRAAVFSTPPPEGRDVRPKTLWRPFPAGSPIYVHCRLKARRAPSRGGFLGLLTRTPHFPVSPYFMRIREVHLAFEYPSAVHVTRRGLSDMDPCQGFSSLTVMFCDGTKPVSCANLSRRICRAHSYRL